MWALWYKAWRDVRWQLLASIALVFAFFWIRVWITSLFPLQQFRRLLQFIPDAFMPLLPVSIEQVATVAGRLAIAFDDPLPLMVMLAWGIGRGSDVVAGELGRGTLEMLLAQPVRRISIIGTQVIVTLVGAALIAAATLSGTAMGIQTVKLEETVSPSVFLSAAVSVFAMTVFLAGATTLVSSFDRFRARTIGVMAGLFAVSLLLKVVGLVGPDHKWLLHFSFLTAYEPQWLVANADLAWKFTAPDGKGSWVWGGLSQHAVLLGLGGLGYLLAIWHFCRRDMPAPL
jgi:ABC-2 type transport system permease protein